MDKQAKRYLITWSIVIVAMFTALGIVLYQARHQLSQADGDVVPSQSHTPSDAEAPPAAFRDRK